MILFKHLLKIITKILCSSYSYGRLRVLAQYVKLFLASVIHHKLKQGIKSIDSFHTIYLLDIKINFYTYPQLVNLFEEIFIYQPYKFTSKNDQPLIFDCGSNIGLSVLYFKKLYPNCYIIAFEPDEDNFKLLKKNVEENNLRNVTIHNLALSDREGEAMLYKKSSAKGHLNMSLLRSSEESFQTVVNTKKLSLYVTASVDFIKIDVEGSELAIIEDLLHHDKIQFIKKMTIEYHPKITSILVSDFIKKLKLHYRVSFVYDTLHSGATEVMVYCEHS